MNRSAFSAFLAMGAMALLAAQSPAWANDDARCQRVAEALCGSPDFAACAGQDQFWADLPESCQGYVQTTIENAREALEQDQALSGTKQKSPGGQYGASFSCGGILRSKPSMNSAKVASVPFGQRFDSVEDAEVWTDEYKWFRVRYGNLEGYQWGGIFWTEGGREGTIPSCDG